MQHVPLEPHPGEAERPAHRDHDLLSGAVVGVPSGQVGLEGLGDGLGGGNGLHRRVRRDEAPDLLVDGREGRLPFRVGGEEVGDALLGQVAHLRVGALHMPAVAVPDEPRDVGGVAAEAVAQLQPGLGRPSGGRRLHAQDGSLGQHAAAGTFPSAQEELQERGHVPGAGVEPPRGAEHDVVIGERLPVALAVERREQGPGALGEEVVGRVHAQGREEVGGHVVLEALTSHLLDDGRRHRGADVAVRGPGAGTPSGGAGLGRQSEALRPAWRASGRCGRTSSWGCRPSRCCAPGGAPPARNPWPPRGCRTVAPAPGPGPWRPGRACPPPRA